jgi:3D (Asp-Asp-Asp) domain-containing protein
MRYVISRSLGRKLGVMCLACVTFVLLYEVSMFDARELAPQSMVDPTLPAAGSRLVFDATAYCKGTTTASGVGVRTGIAASDPSILPVGSVVNISTDNTRYNGVYTIMDTGPRVQGRILDLYMWSCHEALAFGRRPVEITVLRLGWNPRDSTPSLVDRLFRRREAVRASRPPASAPAADASADGASSANDAMEGATGVDDALIATESSTGAGANPTVLDTPSNHAPSNSTLAPSAPVAPVAPAVVVR